MQPAVPDDPRDARSAEDTWLSADEVGAFEQGTPFSRWALARYLVGRAIGESVSTTLLIVVVALLALAAASGWGLHSTALAVVLVLLALLVLAVRAVLRAILRRFTDADRYGPVETKLRQLVDDTHRDVLRELRRVGLPSHTLTLPLLAFRLVGRRRPDTVVRLRAFRTENAVPAGRLDELHLVLRSGETGGPAARR
jgi:hypothetical protein